MPFYMQGHIKSNKNILNKKDLNFAKAKLVSAVTITLILCNILKEIT